MDFEITTADIDSISFTLKSKYSEPNKTSTEVWLVALETQFQS